MGFALNREKEYFSDRGVDVTMNVTFDLNVDVKFNEKWSGHVGIEADGPIDNPGLGYNGAYIQYKPADFFAVKLGDLTYSEGAFKAYYGYDDPAYNAAGMKEHDIRGIEIDLAGLELGLGFGRGENDRCNWGDPAEDDGCKVYNAHVAYEFDYAGQHLRPYFDYKSYQQTQHNEMHAGVDAGVSIGGFAFRAVYGFHADYLMDDEDVVNDQDWTTVAHTILAEPTFNVSMFEIKTTFFYAFIDEGDTPTSDIFSGEIPEYMFAYGEADIKLSDPITVGLVGELHTNSLDDDSDLGSLNFGARLYFTPVDGLEVTGFAMAVLPMGDDWEKAGHEQAVSTEDYGEDMNLKFGVESIFSF